jgi:hypothetical protein
MEGAGKIISFGAASDASPFRTMTHSKSLTPLKSFPKGPGIFTFGSRIQPEHLLTLSIQLDTIRP